MNNNKQIVWIVLGCLLLIGLYLFKFHINKEIKQDGKLYTVGILQTASHPALDAARQGFIDEIQAQVGDKINFVINNGQGSISTIHTIAQQFHAKQDINGVFAIATPAAQAMISIEKEKPICIAAVSVTPALFLSEENVCGVSDMIDVKAEITAMKELLPQIKTVGILFSSAEVNSVAMVDIMIQEIEKIGLMAQVIGVTSEADIEPALMSSLRKIDVLLTPTDNMVANAITLIVDLMQKAGKPLIVSDNMLVKYGALMARGVDYYQSGKQAGNMIMQIFMQNKKPSELSIVKAQTKEIYINKQVCETLGIIIPDSIKKDVVLVPFDNFL